MWYIKNAAGRITYLKPNKLMIVSRKEGHNIILENDASISKLHASICVRPKVNFKHNEPSSAVIVQDTNSKYGTYIIDVNNQQRKLTPGDHEVTATDKIRFGLQHHIFTFHYIPLIISTSTLNTSEKAEVRSLINTLDGVIVEKWEEYCTHLTVSNVTLTAQVVSALAFGTPIVDLKYWHAVSQSVEKNEQLPDIANFIPTISEGTINKESVSLKANAARRTLFKNLNFICFSNTQYYLEDIIKCAGGKLKLFKKGSFELKQLCSENFVLIQLGNNITLPTQSSIASYDAIQQTLQKKKLRLIPESEIFLAILYCSTEKYCNPKFDFKRLLSLSGINKNYSSGTILAADTEDVLIAARNIPAVVINESLTASEQLEKQESANLKQRSLSLVRKLPAENMKDSTRSAIASRIISEKRNPRSPESFQEDVLQIDATMSSIESDEKEVSGKLVKKQEISAMQSNTHRLNVQSKPRAPKSAEENTGKNKSRAQNPKRNSDDDLYSNPSTSKDTFLKRYRDSVSSEDEETLPKKRTENISGQKSKEKYLKTEIVPQMKTDKMEEAEKTLKLPKRNRTEEEDMVSFTFAGPAKKKKIGSGNAGDGNLFNLFEDSDEKDSDLEENMFEKELNKNQKPLNKNQKPLNKMRRSSLSSNASSSEDEKPIKIEKPDSDDEPDYRAPLISCKKELDSSIDETCKSSIVSLLRTDIKISLDDSTANSKTFIKVYNLIPKQRIKIKNMYVWKYEDETAKTQKVESTSSEDDDDADAEFRNEKQYLKPAKGNRKYLPRAKGKSPFF